MIILHHHYRGTERQKVANDYAKRLHIGQVQCQVHTCSLHTCTYIHVYVCMCLVMGYMYVQFCSVQGLMNDYLTTYLSSFENATSPSFQFCEYLNISVCPASETNYVSETVSFYDAHLSS